MFASLQVFAAVPLIVPYVFQIFKYLYHRQVTNSLLLSKLNEDRVPSCQTLSDKDVISGS